MAADARGLQNTLGGTLGVLRKTIADCIIMPDFRFCTPSDDQSISDLVLGYGYCCPKNGYVYPECSDQTKCSYYHDGKPADALVATYETFYPGLVTNHTVLCGGPLNFTASLSTKQQANILIPSPTYSCEYRISVPTLKYYNSGKLLVWLEQQNNVLVYAYSGTSHSNLTKYIEAN